MWGAQGEHSDVLRELVARMLSVKPDNRPGMAEVDQIACRQYLHIVRTLAIQPTATHTPSQHLSLVDIPTHRLGVGVDGGRSWTRKAT
jgi:hypothetical protein